LIKAFQHICGVILMLFTVFPGFGQSSNYVYTNYTIENGLPSNECYEVLQDSRGYMWFATDRGVARFDGYNFKVYQKEEGLGDPVIFHMQEDEQGRIWMGGLSNQMYVYYPKEDSIRAYAFNHLITEHSTHRLQYLKRFHKFRDTLYIGLKNEGILKISDEGTFRITPICDPIKHFIYTIDKRTWMIREEFGVLANFKNFNRLAILEEGKPCGDLADIILPFTDKSKRVNYYATKFDSSYYFYVAGNFYALDDSLRYLGARKKINHIGLTSDHEFVVSHEFKGGTLLYSDNDFTHADTLITDVSSTYFMEDRDKGFWICTLEEGVFYIPKLKAKYIDDIHKGEYFNNLILANDDKLLSTSFNGKIYSYDINQKRSRLISNEHRDIFFIEYDKDRDEIWFSHDTLKYIDSNGPHAMVIQHKELNLIMSSKDVFFQNGLLVFGTITRWGKIDLNSKDILSYSYYDNSDFLYPRINELYVEDSLIYFGTHRGLYILDGNDSYKKYFDDPVSIRIDKIKKLKGNVLLLGTKGHGIILFDQQNKSTLAKFDTKNGMSSNSIEDISIDSSGTVWLSTPKGLDELIFDEDWNIDVLRSYNMHNGMPSNLIYQSVTLKDAVYSATAVGVIRFEKPDRTDWSPKPILISRSDQKSFKTTTWEEEGSHGKFEVEYLTLNYVLAGNVQYRYRLNGQDWIETRKTSLRFSDLSPAKYFLELQSRNEEGIWSSSLEVPFNISPPFWKTWWFRLIAILLIVGMVYLFMNRRLQIRKKSQEIQAEIQRLEKLALRSQMNPHFIFNSLNSIQHFIMSNDKGEAMEYLSMFARLIRMTLNMANQECVKLEEEIELLEHYLELEKMRFDGRFDYSIEVDDIDKFNTLLPPMLIQPIVENAVVHGIRAKVDNGKIRVVFRYMADLILVEVYDNGPGFETKITADNTRKTYGLDVTRKRLELDSIAQKRNGRIAIERIDDHWTKVSLFIPYKYLKK
jgi:hypothetical protein